MTIDIFNVYSNIKIWDAAKSAAPCFLYKKCLKKLTNHLKKRKIYSIIASQWLEVVKSV